MKSYVTAVGASVAASDLTCTVLVIPVWEPCHNTSAAAGSSSGMSSSSPCAAAELRRWHSTGSHGKVMA